MAGGLTQSLLKQDGGQNQQSIMKALSGNIRGPNLIQDGFKARVGKVKPRMGPSGSLLRLDVFIY